MRAWLKIARLSRPALAVAALYALVLGTYLGALAPLPGALPPTHILCSSQEATDPSGPAVPAPEHRDCCTAACLNGASLVPPGGAFETVSPPAHSPVGWVPRDPAGSSLAIPRDTRVRGPPLA